MAFRRRMAAKAYALTAAYDSMISQWFAFATNGFNAIAVATDSAISLYIFQFPAMIGFLIAVGC